MPVQLPDGEYPDVLGGSTVVVTQGTIPSPTGAVVLAFTQPFAPRRWTPDLLDPFLDVEELGDQ